MSFNNFGLTISIANEHYALNCLDVNLNLVTNKIRNLNKHFMHINSLSNYSISGKVTLIDNIGKRISMLSFDYDTFNKPCPYF